MQTISKFLFAASVFSCVGLASGFAQQTLSPYSGNQSTGFGGPLGQSTLSITDNGAAGQVSFSLTLGGNNTGFNDIAFYLNTGSNTETSTADITDTGDEGREAISGNSAETGRSLVQFASGFSAQYAVAIDANGHANLFQIVPGQGYLTYLSGANYTHPSSNVYGFSINESQIGLTAGSSFNFVATLSNANSDGKLAFYRSNETIGASNVDNNSAGNLGPNGALIYSGFDTYATSVPEPATWLGASFCVALFGRFYVLRRRQAGV